MHWFEKRDKKEYNRSSTQHNAYRQNRAQPGLVISFDTENFVPRSGRNMATFRTVPVGNDPHATIHDIQQAAKDSGLHKAILADRADAIELLLDGGANANAEDYNDGRCLYPLHRAAAKGYLKAAILLVERGGVVNCLDYLNRTPLDLANMYSSSNDTSLICYLESKGGKLHRPDTLDKDP